MAVYNPLIPQAVDDPSVSQGQILDNFTILNTAFDVDHETYDSAAADRGKHNQATLVDLAGVPASGAGEGTIYTNTVGARLEAFYQYPAAGPVVQLSAIKAWCTFNGAAVGPIAITDGYNVTNITRNGNGDYTLNLTTALGNATYAVLLTMSDGGGAGVGTVFAKAVATCRIGTRLGGALVDALSVNVVIVGN